jgi:flagellar protein FlgJ
MKPSEFTKTYYPFAMQDLSGIPPLLTLAQSALESGWGEHAPGNNFFGIKCGKSWTGKKQLLTTHEILNRPDGRFPEVISVLPLNNGKFKYTIKDWFRAYDSPLDSFTDHSNLLLRNWKDCISEDPICTITKIQASGHAYATDPHYVNSIAIIIEMIKKNIPNV